MRVVGTVGAGAGPRLRRRERVRARARRACRARRTDARVAVRALPGVTVVPPGAAHAGRRRSLQGVHAVLPPVARVPAPAARGDTDPRASCPTPSARARSPGSATWSPATRVTRRRCRGGETAARARLDAWAGHVGRGLRRPPRRPRRRRDVADLAVLHFGCVSPLEVAQPSSAGRAPTRSCASCAGATSTTRSSPPGPMPRGPTTARAATTGTTTPSVRRVARGPHRLSGRRRRHAPARTRASCTTGPA